MPTAELELYPAATPVGFVPDEGVVGPTILLKSHWHSMVVCASAGEEKQNVAARASAAMGRNRLAKIGVERVFMSGEVVVII
jgi:hypothetical protein